MSYHMHHICMVSPPCALCNLVCFLRLEKRENAHICMVFLQYVFCDAQLDQLDLAHLKNPSNSTQYERSLYSMNKCGIRSLLLPNVTLHIDRLTLI